MVTHTAEDGALVEAQLGRDLRGEWTVACRCHLGVPVVIESYPRMPDGAPFPTLFWLTCPALAKRVSKLEGEGWMAGLNERLGSDAGLVARLGNDIDRYRARRDSHEVVEGGGGPPGGGPDRVKCLHAHVAHELPDPPNAAGGLALAATGYPDCREPCYRVTT